MSNAAPMSSVNKSGQTWSIVLDQDGGNQALYVYSSPSALPNHYIAKIAADGSYTVGSVTYGPTGMTGGTYSVTGITISSNLFGVVGVSSFTSNSTSDVPVTIYGQAGQSGDLFDVKLTSGGAKEFWVDSAGLVNANISIAVNGSTWDGITLQSKSGNDLNLASNKSTGKITFNFNKSTNSDGIYVYDGGSTNNVHVLASGSGGTLSYNGTQFISTDTANTYLTSLTPSGLVYFGNSSSSTGYGSISSSGLVIGSSTYAATSTTVNGTLTATTIHITNPLGTIYGGTGIGTYAVGDILYASTTTALSALSDVATGNVLLSGGVSTAPSWGKVSLTAAVSGVLPVANGGTGSGTQNFVDLTTGQTVAGVKTFSSAPVSANGFTAGSSSYGATTATVNGTLTATTLNLTNPTAAIYGGTGQASYAIGDILYASTTTALSKLADVATGNALISGGVNTAPSWGKISLTTTVSGILPVANGGTNSATQNWVDLTTGQTIAGIKTFSSAPVSANGFTAGSSTYGATSSTVIGTSTATLFSGSGASLTNLNAGNISSGIVPATAIDFSLSYLNKNIDNIPDALNYYSNADSLSSTTLTNMSSGTGGPGGATDAETTGTGSSIGSNLNFSQTQAVTPGVTYTPSWWIDGSQVLHGVCNLEVLDIVGNTIVSDLTPVISGLASNRYAGPAFSALKNYANNSDSLSGWTLQNLTADTSGPGGANDAIQLGTGSAGGTVLLQYPVTIVPGSVYSASFWVDQTYLTSGSTQGLIGIGDVTGFGTFGSNATVAWGSGPGRYGKSNVNLPINVSPEPYSTWTLTGTATSSPTAGPGSSQRLRFSSGTGTAQSPLIPVIAGSTISVSALYAANTFTSGAATITGYDQTGTAVPGLTISYGTSGYSRRAVSSISVPAGVTGISIKVDANGAGFTGTLTIQSIQVTLNAADPGGYISSIDPAANIFYEAVGPVITSGQKLKVSQPMMVAASAFASYYISYSNPQVVLNVLSLSGQSGGFIISNGQKFKISQPMLRIDGVTTPYVSSTSSYRRVLATEVTNGKVIALDDGTYRYTPANLANGIDTTGKINVSNPKSGSILPIANGGTGSATQNFVDLTTGQTVAGVKTFSSAPVSANGFTAGSSTYGATSSTVNGTLTATTLNLTNPAAAIYGGTGQSSYAIGDILYASTGTALSKLADVATGNALISGGVTTAPSWGKIGLTTHVSGTLAVGNGGTGLASYTIGDILYASGSGALSALAGVATGNVLISGGTGTAPSWGKVSLTTAVSGILPVANGGTGSGSQNFVDLTTGQTIAGVKTFSSAPVSANGLTSGSSTYGPTSATIASSTNPVTLGVSSSYTSQALKIFSGGGAGQFTDFYTNTAATIATVNATAFGVDIDNSTNLLAFSRAGNLGIVGGYYTGSSSYGPTSATVNGTLTASTVTSTNGYQIGGTNTLINSSGYTYLYAPLNGFIFHNNSTPNADLATLTVTNGGTFSAPGGYNAGSSSYGPTSATITTSGTGQVGLSIAGGTNTFKFVTGTASPYYGAIYGGDTNSANAGGWRLGLYDGDGSHHWGDISAIAGFVVGSSSYGPTSASINGDLSVNNINGNGLLKMAGTTTSTTASNAAAIGWNRSSTQGEMNLYSLYNDTGAPNGNAAFAFWGYNNGTATNYAYLTRSSNFVLLNSGAFTAGSSTYGPTSCTVNGTITAGGIINSTSATAKCLLAADAGGQNYLESGNLAFTANAIMNITGYNAGQGSTLNLNYATTVATGTFNNGSNAIATNGGVNLMNDVSSGGQNVASVWIGRDGAATQGLNLNVPTSSTNGWRFLVNGATVKFQIDVSGNTTAAGSSTATGFFVSSARAMKKNIKPISFDALAAIKKAEIVEYVYRKGNGEKKLGFIADDVPDELSPTHDSFDTTRVLSAALRAIQQLEARIVELENA